MTKNADEFYLEVESGLQKHNVSENDTEYFKTKKFNPVKFIFNNLKEKLKDTNHIIFLFSWVNHLPTTGTNDFESIVYDLDNHKKYYIYNFRENFKNIIIKESLPSDLNGADTIIENYKLNKIEYLKSLQTSTSAELGQDYLIQNINLQNHINKTSVFKSLVTEHF
ncbi:hypothetical protein [Flavobacterium sp. 3HN19-14]|uniref:hypothetical protein n=1 Tax=Flavobacterium sp. 3HN19-14 TaxID=3448133 RepID=UPI003EE2C642